MRAQRDDGPDRTRGRRRAGFLTWAGVVVAVVLAAAFALRGRRPAVPAFLAQQRPAADPPAPPAVLPPEDSEHGAPPRSRHLATPSPEPLVEPVAEPAIEPVIGSVSEPVSEPVLEPVLEPVPEPVAEPVVAPVPAPPAGRAGGGLSQLVRVSGLGRRSAEALVVAGIASLEALAASDPAALAAALDAAGVKRSATLATWPQQAAKLLHP
jgi:predicted flap endonuclease-1-like 5' DNA nuclease